jgi:hypothetical protein
MRKQVEHLLVALVFVAAALAGATSALGCRGRPSSTRSSALRRTFIR